MHLGNTSGAYNAADNVAASSATFDGDFTPGEMQGNVTGRTETNQIKYVSPNFSGVTVAVSQSRKNNKNAAFKNTNGASVVYKAGALTAAYGQQSATLGKINIISAAYNLGVASVSFGTSTLKAKLANGAASNKTTGNTLGVAMPMGAITLSAAYGSNEVKSATGVKVSDASSFGLAAKYDLSKRTFLMVGINNGTVKTVAGNGKTTTKLQQVGLQHSF